MESGERLDGSGHGGAGFIASQRVDALRYFNGYGSRQALCNSDTGIVAIFSSRLLNGERPRVCEAGEQTRDFIHVSDVLRANLAVRLSPVEAGGTYNFGTRCATRIRRPDELLAERLDSAFGLRILGRDRAGELRHGFADIERAVTEPGVRSEVRFEDGIEEVISWVRTQAASDGAEQAEEERPWRGLSR